MIGLSDRVGALCAPASDSISREERKKHKICVITAQIVNPKKWGKNLERFIYYPLPMLKVRF
jgi:hypothetical protein